MDIDHDGVSEAVYRSINNGMGLEAWNNLLIRMQDYPAKEPYLTTKRQEEFRAERYTEDVSANNNVYITKGELKSAIHINVEGFPKGVPEKAFFHNNLARTGLTDIIAVNGKHYLLVIRTGEVRPPFSLHLLQLKSNIQQQQVCRFDSQYLIQGISQPKADTGPTIATLKQADWDNKIRPSDFYRLSVNHQANVCPAVLSALNETVHTAPDVPNERQNIHAPLVYPPWPWFSFMHTRYSVDWQAISMRYSGWKNTGRAIVDLDHDGVPEAVYRDIDGKRGYDDWFNLLTRMKDYPAEEPFMTGKRLDELYFEGGYTDNILTETNFPIQKDSSKSSIYINVEGFPDGMPDKMFQGRLGLAEIVRVEGKDYLLVTRSGVVKPPVSLHLLQLKTNIRQTQLCRFDSQYLIQPDADQMETPQTDTSQAETPQK